MTNPIFIMIIINKNTRSDIGHWKTSVILQSILNSYDGELRCIGYDGMSKLLCVNFYNLQFFFIDSHFIINFLSGASEG